MREINHMNTLRQAAVSCRTLNDFLGEHGAKPMQVYAADNKTKLYDTVVDWQTLTVAKGIAYGLYLEMKSEGAEFLAKEILLQEGVPQYVTGKQQNRLDYYDNL